MGIILYEHNRIAYDAALTMLREKGKAAVIHPTGTGKSFLAFCLCEEHPESNVCFLSPSEYIFKTQLENWVAAGGSVPKNIRFLTYAKLYLMEEPELSELKPDYIVLDEFHRCGAKAWGQGVENLRRVFPNVPLLGLSATNIRYLDNRRDMAEELFDNNIASEITIGEAIVRGILMPPKYVLSLFSYKREYERYEARVRQIKNKGMQVEAGRYLEALRRALELAEGLEEMFEKHLPDRSGRYLVFCANLEHMQEMKEKVPEWFGRIDKKPHIYTVYSEYAETDKEFAAFKKDNSKHLKLLFCIDMLNEGVHVEDVSGVILLRPTVSPIVYKQQIGRALSAGGKKETVIFDIVLNIEGLYSIGAIEQEMKEAMTFYRANGKGDMVVNEQFRVIDEVKDCRALFERLNQTLSASWECMYTTAEQYYKVHGDLDVPKRYVTEDGFSLGAWIATQRRVATGKIKGHLTEEQKERLTAIGMRWQEAKEVAWSKYYAAAKAYYNRYGNLLVNVNEEAYGEVPLGSWIAKLRTLKKANAESAYLTPERVEALERIGMVWDVPDYYWEQNYQAAKKYYETHGTLLMSHDYVDENGIRLGAWIAKQRRAKEAADKAKEQENQTAMKADVFSKEEKTCRESTAETAQTALTKEQEEKLLAIGMTWETRHDSAWQSAYEELCLYYEEHGNLNVPVGYLTKTGCHLGKWIRYQRESYKTTLSAERKRKLDALGMEWEPEDPWESKFNLARTYYEEHGDLNMKSNYVVDGVWLAKWLREQSKRLVGEKDTKGEQKTRTTGNKRKVLTPVQIGKLRSIGVGR